MSSLNIDTILPPTPREKFFRAVWILGCTFGGVLLIGAFFIWLGTEMGAVGW